MFQKKCIKKQYLDGIASLDAEYFGVLIVKNPFRLK